MVALCRQCGAPLTPADLGHTRCLTCHWQDVFEEAPGADGLLELRLVLYLAPRWAATRGQDRGGRFWTRLAGAGATWCGLCGAPVEDGWIQGQAGWLQTAVCAEHVHLRPQSARARGFSPA